jgi:hypothetical protein
LGNWGSLATAVVVTTLVDGARRVHGDRGVLRALARQERELDTLVTFAGFHLATNDRDHAARILLACRPRMYPYDIQLGRHLAAQLDLTDDSKDFSPTAPTTTPEPSTWLDANSNI